MRYLIRFSYDGTGFSGYQKQPGERTVEGMLENALYNINNHTETRIFSSGRTDRGVHALGQAAHFDIDVNITLYKLKCALNSLLPEDIHVLSTEIVDKNFHARYNAISKTYIYKINVGEYSPIDRNHIYQYCKDLNFDNMRLAINDFLGEHDFKPFVSEEAIKSSYVRTIYSVDMKKEGDIITISFTGNGFMKYQVRNMVGVLIKIGSGKLTIDSVKNILNGTMDKSKITTAKGSGLYLKEVVY